MSQHNRIYLNLFCSVLSQGLSPSRPSTRATSSIARLGSAPSRVYTRRFDVAFASALGNLQAALRQPPLTLGDLARERIPWLFELKATDGVDTWTYTQTDSGWTAERARRRGRPKRNEPVDRLGYMRWTYDEALADFQALKRELTKRRRALRGRRGYSDHFLRDHQWQWLQASTNTRWKKVTPSTKGKPTVVTLFGERRTAILWDDFCRGQFAPKDLTLDYVAKLFRRSPTTVRNTLKTVPKERGEKAGRA